MQAPFPWFGGKSKVAAVVWDRLGDVDNYVEPFAGSLAVLLSRPSTHLGTTETVNDKDRYLANFWRALAAAPDEVAKWADWPVNEADLTARHIWLVNEGRTRLESIEANPDFYDAKIAGWWVWGICSWIGSGWCSGNGPWSASDGKLVHLGDAGQGVNRKRVHLGTAGQGVNRQRVDLGDAGRGVHRRLVHLGTAGQGIYRYLNELASRLRHVRVCCGDWARVVTDGALTHGATVGVFLDPPYSQDERNKDIYVEDTLGLALAVRDWALAHGDDPRLRIALCGYDGEYEMPNTWEQYAWKAGASYKTHRGDLTLNRYRERIWFSPHCVRGQAMLFDLENG